MAATASTPTTGRAETAAGAMIKPPDLSAWGEPAVLGARLERMLFHLAHEYLPHQVPCDVQGRDSVVNAAIAASAASKSHSRRRPRHALAFSSSRPHPNRGNSSVRP